MRHLRIITVFSALCCIIFSCKTFAADRPEIISLQKSILKADCKEDIVKPLDELKGLYLKENRYSDFVEFLKPLAEKKGCFSTTVSYYIEFARYTQLKYLEEKQLWDEYFSQGNNYRDDITASAQKVIEKAEVGDPILVRSRLILWQFHRDQEDPFAQEALSGLMDVSAGYVATGKDVGVIKEVADKLLAYAEKSKAKELYRLYAGKLITLASSDEQFKVTAQNFYQEGNPELAQTFYDIYAERISKAGPKEKACPSIIEIAKLFVYKDTGLKDPLYAEKMFQKAQELCGKEAFDEGLLYLRAFNLEKAKEFVKAKDVYGELLQRYPKSAHANEANFKVGVIYVYGLGDLSSGKAYFNKLADKNETDGRVISSLYQLGLFAQWQEDYDSAKKYYNKLIILAGSDYQDMVVFSRQRLQEIDDKKPIEYNLKTFLDASLKEGNASLDMTKSSLSASRYLLTKNNETQLTCIVNMPASGCMQPEVQYLWSGDMGSAQPQNSQANFNTSYPSKGTKVINLIIVLPAGLFDRNLDFVDVE